MTCCTRGEEEISEVDEFNLKALAGRPGFLTVSSKSAAGDGMLGVGTCT